MQDLDLEQMTAMVKVIAEEKGLSEETVLDVIQAAIAAAWRRENAEREANVRSELNMNTGEAKVFLDKIVVEPEVAYNPVTEIPADDPQAKGKNIGDVVSEEFKVKSFGRVASTTAKQVIVQRLREAEKETVLAAFKGKLGTIMTGVVARIEPRVVRVELGKATGILLKQDQIEGERYTVGQRLKVLVKEIQRDERGAQLLLSRADAEFIRQLFIQEVPEVDNGTVEIRSIAREAGRRTKIAVMATTPGIDPVGTFVGGRGVRVQAVMNEVGDREKIDIVNWSDNPSEYLRDALSPAEIIKVEVTGKTAKVYVAKDQQSIAIGRQGQNVRLASKLTGYEIDIEVIEPPKKKKKVNVEDSLLEAIEDAEE